MKTKNILFGAFIGLLAFLLFDCASTPAQSAGTNTSAVRTTTQVGMDLDVAIKEAATQMESRIPAGTMIALVSVASPSNAFSTQVLTRLESALVSNGKLVVVDRANLDKVRAEQGFQLSGEVDDESAKSIGKLLGAGAIVTGSLTDLGDVYSLALKSINIETATVAMSYLADLTKTQRIETLLSTRDTPTTARTQPTVQASQQPVPPQVVQAPAPASVVSALPIKMGVWKVSGRDNQNTIWSADLIIENYRNNTFTGYFDWYSGANETYRGREYYNGEYNELRHRVMLRGSRLERASGLGLGSYQARVSNDGMKFLTGSWAEGVPGEWEAEWIKDK